MLKGVATLNLFIAHAHWAIVPAMGDLGEVTVFSWVPCQTRICMPVYPNNTSSILREIIEFKLPRPQYFNNSQLRRHRLLSL